MPGESRSVAERFWSKVDRSGDCWLWTAYINDAGYGHFGVRDGVTVKAHRFAYELVRGAIPEGLTLDHRHTCPKHCVNPTHLRPATDKQQQENRAGAQRNSQSGVRGVYWRQDRGLWQAQVKHHKKNICVGRFTTKEEAEAAVIAKRIELFTHNNADRIAG
jgi:hypothetical protein